MSDPETSNTPAGRFGKFGLIEHITRETVIYNKSTVTGKGDDSAVIDSGNELTLVSTDLLLEGIHFNLVYTPLKHLGYKAVIRAISDIYAMNGTPEQILIAVGISTRFKVEHLEELYEGIGLACKRYRTDLAGGDTTSSLTGMTIGVTAIGRAGRDSIVRRNGARPNDLICATGSFGASYMGLQVLERERKIYDKDNPVQPDLSGYEYIIERQLKPEFPEKVLKDLAAGNILPTSMIDVSDGLASDLIHLCRLSDTGCRIYHDRIPVDNETWKSAEEFNIDPMIPALNGGEDYELLFTLPLEHAEKIKTIPDVALIGHMTGKEQGCFLVTGEGNEVELRAQGWEKE
ncbi:MAG: thiamine-phosphate kinase [Bacteroidales bacterium]|nr:thiamine-phosphate kinase [Bacteroidales bacterium]